jgi:Leucine-rich repeat (LRR) protein
MHRIVLSIVLLLNIVACNHTNSSNMTAEEYSSLDASEETIIALEQLNAHTPDSMWEQFFIQRGGEKLWKRLQKKGNKLMFFFNTLTEPSEDITQQANDITAAITHYLVHHQVPVRSILFVQSRKSLNQRLTSLPSSIGNLISLQSLDLSSNEIKELPAEIVKLTKLKKIDLSANQLRELPANIIELTSLQELNLSNNQLQELPLDIGKLNSLEDLELSYNQFVEIPAAVGNLSSLQTLSICSNPLTEISPVISKLTSLTNLILYSNQISTIPAEIGHLSNLKALKMSSNELTTISSEIGKLSKLTDLYLPTNHLKTLPPEIGKLISLQDADLAHNQLSTLPNELCKLTNLEELDVSYNQLSTLPNELCKLASLKALRLTSNQLTKLPVSIISKLHNAGCKLRLGKNPWIDTSSSQLKKLNIKEIEAAIDHHFPHSLTTLCIQYIETHPELFVQKELQDKLPQELCQIARRDRLRQAYLWVEGKNIIFFKLVKTIPIPCFLDFPLTNPKAVKNMLGEVEKEQFYQILEE